VTEQQPRTRIGQRSILVALLVPAVIVGWIVGTLLGSASNPAASPSPSPTPTPTPTPTASVAPSVAPSTSATPTSTISSSAGPAVSTAPVLKLEGTGNQRSETFDVLVGWQIQWQTDGDHIVVAVTGDQDLGDVVDFPGPASGVVSPPAGGAFRLEITADGPWSVTVIQGTG
jgi:hypothetical protein